MKSMNSLQKFENMSKRTRISRRRLNVNVHIVKHAMKECLLNIRLRNFPSFPCSKTKQNTIIMTGENSTIVLKLKIFNTQSLTMPTNDKACFRRPIAFTRKKPTTR